VIASPDSLAASAFNRALDRAPWALERLAPYAGRTFTITVSPVSTAFQIALDGHLEPASAVSADLRLTLSPLTLPSFLADPKRWNDFVVEDGDVALGGTLKELAQTLPWLVEESFARVFGDVVGQRLADTGRRLLAFPQYAAERVAGSVASYARDEAQLLPRGDEMRQFAAQSADLAVRADALEARIDALARQPDSR
jgi:ubiquinone biosynthesis protein UbiJ